MPVGYDTEDVHGKELMEVRMASDCVADKKSISNVAPTTVYANKTLDQIYKNTMSTDNEYNETTGCGRICAPSVIH